ncbi:MAG: Wiskott-Aldrich syndrome protein [Caudoviricetes sp.]|nr:MAG: Wiskott-Aldrich syndrome protein [Caudoviricetes sp.]
MYDITELVYGFDFSDGKYPDLGTKLDTRIYEFLTEDEPFDNPYTGYCESPCYLGISITNYGLDDNVFDFIKFYEKTVSENKERYDIEIKNKIADVIKILEEEKSLEDEEDRKDLYTNAIIYFNDLKLCEPQKCSIKTTS